MVGVYGMVWGASQLWTGPLSDRWGRKIPIVLGMWLAGAGIAVLPRYLGDAHALLRYLPMPDEPKEAVWIHVHDDVRDAPRVRVVLDFLAETMKRDRSLLLGRRPTKTQR